MGTEMCAITDRRRSGLPWRVLQVGVNDIAFTIGNRNLQDGARRIAADGCMHRTVEAFGISTHVFRHQVLSNEIQPREQRLAQYSQCFGQLGGAQHGLLVEVCLFLVLTRKQAIPVKRQAGKQQDQYQKATPIERIFRIEKGALQRRPKTEHTRDERRSLLDGSGGADFVGLAIS
ncbi:MULTISPECIES: hypothetical protein [Comamonas]|uniref:hypothetical protein n=1 Tax=Comamonas TaxID=283 RepID=UPI00257BB24B|nr:MULTISPECIES: hypothetical protein [Comamonas]